MPPSLTLSPGASLAAELVHHDTGALDLGAVLRLVEHGCTPATEHYTEDTDTVWRATMPDGAGAWLKEYRYTPMRGHLQRFVHSRAHREWVALEAMRAAGLPAARPLALLEWRRHGALRRTMLITEEVAGTRDLATLAADPGTSRGFLRKACRTAGRLAREMHEHGFAHFRLLPRNVLVAVDDPGRAALIDPPYARYWPGGAPRPLRRFDLRQFCNATSVPGELLVEALDGYGDDMRRDEVVGVPRRRRKVERILRYTGAIFSGNAPRPPA